MSFYAYSSILEVSLKLITAILLIMISGNKLTIYMLLLVGVAMMINIIYVLYVRHIVPELRFSIRAERQQIIEIGKFSGWNIITSLSDISYQQGTSMIMNVFFGVTFNASMGIANQVKSAVSSFARSLQLAASPQIIMSYSVGNRQEFSLLFLSISKISFYCVAMLGVPILLNTEYIMELWLTIIPPQGTMFDCVLFGRLSFGPSLGDYAGIGKDCHVPDCHRCCVDDFAADDVFGIQTRNAVLFTDNSYNYY